MAEAPSRTAQIEELQRRLAARARGAGVPSEEAADVAANAIAKAAREHPRRGAPSFDVRAGRLLRDEIADFFRRRSRRFELVELAEEPPNPVTISLGRGLAAREARASLQRILGVDGMRYALWRSVGYSEREIGNMPNWTPAKAAKVRKRIDRAAAMEQLRVLKRQLEEEDHGH